MTAPTTIQVAGFHGDVIVPDQDGYDGAVPYGACFVDLLHANQNIAPATRR